MTKGRRNPKVLPIHIGKKIEEKLAELRISQAELARRMNRPGSTIHQMLRQHSSPAYVIWEVSLALDYDFFSDISRALEQKKPAITGMHSPQLKNLESLQKELGAIKEERDYLKKMVDILAK